jgi:hypothetical protein
VKSGQQAESNLPDDRNPTLEGRLPGGDDAVAKYDGHR